MTTITQTTVIEDMYNDIRTKILQGTLLPGTKLSENTLAKEFSCSRTPVREALKRLEQDGFVVIQPHSGTYVKSPTLYEYQEIAEVRAYLEALAFHLAVEKKADCSKIRDILTKMDELVGRTNFDLVAFGELHYQFHHTLVEMSGNVLLIQSFNRLNLNASNLLFYQTMTKENFALTQTEHRKILNALETQDLKMEKFVYMHLWRKRNNFKKEAEEQQ